MMVGRLLSYWYGIFSGAMLNFQGVILGEKPQNQILKILDVLDLDSCIFDTSHVFLHPGKLTWFTWKWSPGKRRFLLETIIFRWTMLVFGGTGWESCFFPCEFWSRPDSKPFFKFARLSTQTHMEKHMSFMDVTLIYGIFLVFFSENCCTYIKDITHTIHVCYMYLHLG